MRRVWILPLGLLFACNNADEGEDTNGPSCDDPVEYFPDFDGDGWGSASTAVGSVFACTEADASRDLGELAALGEGIAVSLSARDCADDETVTDAAAAITGRIAALCPRELVEAEQPIDLTPLAVTGRELVVVHPGDGVTPQVSAQTAAAACGPAGWGGGVDSLGPRAALVSLVGQPGIILDAIQDALPISVTTYAGWAGIVSDDAASVSLEPGWYWESVDPATNGPIYTSTADTLAFIQFCDDTEPDPGIYDRLALVYDGEDWCMGLPTSAPLDWGGGEVYGDDTVAHFLCERPIPNPDDYPGRP